MTDVFAERLDRFLVSPDDRTALLGCMGSNTNFCPRKDIVAADASSNNLHLVVEGWAFKYRLMSDGRRQIVSFYLPGDVCDLDRLFGTTLGFGIQALTDCTISTIPLDWIAQARSARPAINELLWMMIATEKLAMAEQVVALGRRSSRQRIAYLVYDLLERLQALGLATDGRIRAPLTQNDIADALGLSTVHVNRTLLGLREDGLLEVRGRNFHIPRPAALAKAADYEPLPVKRTMRPSPRNGVTYSGASTMGS